MCKMIILVLYFDVCYMLIFSNIQHSTMQEAHKINSDLWMSSEISVVAMQSSLVMQNKQNAIELIT